MPRLLVPFLAVALGACGSGAVDRVVFEGEGTVAATGLTLVAFEDDDVDGAGQLVEVAVEDSASTRWDLALRGTDVFLNGGAGGPGGAVGVVVDVPYGQVEDALRAEYTYRRDGESPCDGGPARAVCEGDLLTADADPVPGRTLLFRLGDGQGYGKAELLDYDAGAYTLRFTVNPDGSAFSETTDD